MELMQEAAGKGYSDSCREEDLLEEEDELAETASHKQSRFQHQDAPRKPLHLMDFSLGNKEDDVLQAQPNFHGTNSSSTTTTTTDDPVEKEHMFDKVVTPSDVGKLNRLVIPKQHAERYFPLDASTNDKGLLLNFEDRNGKLWRFRYSYWNSSQSYVMTKGWSRFVKEKKLDAGDIVSFHRGLGEMYRHRLYIDWRRRPDHAAVPDHHHHHNHHLLHHPVANSLITPLFAPNQYSIRWGGGGRMYSVPMAPPAPRQPVNYNNYGFQEPQLLLQQQQLQYQQVYGGSGSYNNNEVNLGSGSLYYLRSTATAPEMRQGGGGMTPMIIDSVPVAHGKSSGGSITRTTSDTAGKRLRLFGVNMECSSSSSIANSLSSQNLQCQRESNEEEEEEELEEEEEPVCSSSSGARFGEEEGETSVLFDLNPSFHQYRR